MFYFVTPYSIFGVCLDGSLVLSLTLFHIFVVVLCVCVLSLLPCLCLYVQSGFFLSLVILPMMMDILLTGSNFVFQFWPAMSVMGFLVCFFLSDGVCFSTIVDLYFGFAHSIFGGRYVERGINVCLIVCYGLVGW